MAWLRNVILVGAALLGAATLAQAQEQSEAQSAAATSAVCFNAALYKKGAFLDYNARVTGGFASNQRETDETGGKETFNGVLATEIKSKISLGGDSPFTSFSYLNATSDYLLFYGWRAGQQKNTITPPEKFPVSLARGASLKQTVTYKYVSSDGDVSKTERKSVTTFEGLVTLQTPFGPVSACKFSIKVMSRPSGSSTYQTSNDLRWIAAEAPYRGLTLKAKYGDVDQTYEVTRVRTFDLPK